MPSTFHYRILNFSNFCSACVAALLKSWTLYRYGTSSLFFSSWYTELSRRFRSKERRRTQAATCHKSCNRKCCWSAVTFHEGFQKSRPGLTFLRIITAKLAVQLGRVWNFFVTFWKCSISTKMIFVLSGIFRGKGEDFRSLRQLVARENTIWAEVNISTRCNR